MTAIDETSGRSDFTDPWTKTHPDHPVIDEETAVIVNDAARDLAILRSPLASTDALAVLHALVSLQAQIQAQLADVVADALDQEHSFEEIAGQLAINPATARRRYAAYAKRRTPLAID